VADRKADIVVEMGRIRPSGGDRVNVEVEDQIADWFERIQTGFFFGFLHRDGENVGITIGMASGLQPAVELAVMGEEDAFPRGIDDPGGPGQVACCQRAFEAIVVILDKGSEMRDQGFLFRMPDGIGCQGVEEGLAMHGKGRERRQDSFRRWTVLSNRAIAPRRWIVCPTPIKPQFVSASNRKPTPADSRPPIVLDQTAFSPGERGSVDLPIGSLIDYQPVTMTAHVRRGRRPGPCLLICAALHGDEIVGVEIIRRLLRMKLLNQIRGDLIAIPIVNMPAFLSQSRYLPDRRDLNRLFPGSTKGSLGSRLANCLVTEVVSSCTHAIDLHTGALGRPNLPQIRVSPGDQEGSEMGKAFHAPVMIETSTREGSLRDVFFRSEKPSILYEAGEAHRLEASAVQYGVRGVVAVMRHLGMLPTTRKKSDPDHAFKPRRPSVISPLTSWSRAPQGGIFRPRADLGKAVSPGTILGVVADPFGRHETTITARVDGVVIGTSREATVNEGDALFHIAVTKDPESAEERILESDEVIEEMVDPYVE